MDNLDAAPKDGLGIGQKARGAGNSNARQALEEGNEVLVVIGEAAPALDEGGHEDIEDVFSVEGAADCVCECANCVVEDEEVFSLVFLKGEYEVAEDGVEVGFEGGACVFLEGGKGGAACLLDALVVVEDHAEELRGVSGVNAEDSTHALHCRDKVLFAVVLGGGACAPVCIAAEGPAGDGADEGLDRVSGEENSIDSPLGR